MPRTDGRHHRPLRLPHLLASCASDDQKMTAAQLQAPWAVVVPWAMCDIDMCLPVCLEMVPSVGMPAAALHMPLRPFSPESGCDSSLPHSLEIVSVNPLTRHHPSLCASTSGQMIAACASLTHGVPCACGGSGPVHASLSEANASPCSSLPPGS